MRTIITSQPEDAPRSREDYAADPAYLGQPKRDGVRCVAFASTSGVRYQSRSGASMRSPSVAIDDALSYAAYSTGECVLDCELVWFSADGGEHRTEPQAERAGGPAVCRLCVFSALFSGGADLREERAAARIRAAQPIVGACCSSSVELVPTAWTTVQKLALIEQQQREGREGEVWYRRSSTYVPGPAGEDMTRTKYLSETDCIIVSISERAVDVADGSRISRVGTGWTAAEFAALAVGQTITIRHQGRTETGALWHARFLRHATPCAAAA